MAEILETLYGTEHHVLHAVACIFKDDQLRQARPLDFNAIRRNQIELERTTSRLSPRDNERVAAIANAPSSELQVVVDSMRDVITGRKDHELKIVKEGEEK